MRTLNDLRQLTGPVKEVLGGNEPGGAENLASPLAVRFVLVLGETDVSDTGGGPPPAIDEQQQLPAPATSHLEMRWNPLS